MYPHIISTTPIGVGPPTIVRSVKEGQTIDFKKNGIYSIRIRPPRQLYAPTLPYRSPKDKTLTFSLCSKCADFKSKRCNHTNLQRDIFGMYSNLDIETALESGYELIECFQYYQWEQTDNSLFTQLVHQFYKTKVLSSPWPEHLETDQQKQSYVDQMNERYGWSCDIEDFQFNPIYRWIAKVSNGL
jgi:hypothetical protein